jgi:hypothetical protein
VALRACLIAAAILAGTAFVGDWLLRTLSISLPAFRIAGGLLLAPRLGLDPIPDRDALAEELFFWTRRGGGGGSRIRGARLRAGGARAARHGARAFELRELPRRGLKQAAGAGRSAPAVVRWNGVFSDHHRPAHHISGRSQPGSQPGRSQPGPLQTARGHTPTNRARCCL